MGRATGRRGTVPADATAFGVSGQQVPGTPLEIGQVGGGPAPSMAKSSTCKKRGR